jgi:hypothetical protein
MISQQTQTNSNWCEEEVRIAIANIRLQDVCNESSLPMYETFPAHVAPHDHDSCSMPGLCREVDIIRNVVLRGHGGL